MSVLSRPSGELGRRRLVMKCRRRGVPGRSAPASFPRSSCTVTTSWEPPARRPSPSGSASLAPSPSCTSSPRSAATPGARVARPAGRRGDRCRDDDRRAWRLEREGEAGARVAAAFRLVAGGLPSRSRVTSPRLSRPPIRRSGTGCAWPAGGRRPRSARAAGGRRPCPRTCVCRSRTAPGPSGSGSHRRVRRRCRPAPGWRRR